MFGFLNMTPEALKRWSEREREKQRRVDALLATGMHVGEAYSRVFCEMECEERDAIQQAKLADIRENGT